MSIKLTVLMSVYNGEYYLRQSIESVLKQSFQEFEFLIIDDGSTDRSREIIKSFDDKRIRLIVNDENLGLIGSLNKGLEESRGEYVARQDADDVCHTERFSTQIQLLDSDKSLFLVGSQLGLIDENGASIGVWAYPENPVLVKWFLLFNSAVAHSSSMYRKDPVTFVGGYSSDAIYAEDYDLWSKLSRHGKINNSPDVLQYYRIHDEAVSQTRKQQQSDTRFNISSSNINNLFSEPLDDASLEYISGCKSPQSFKGLTCMIDGLNEVFGAFVKVNVCEANVQAIIRNDIIERLSSAFQMVGFHSRMMALLARPDVFPLSFWLKGRFILFLLSNTVKDRIKSVVSRNI